MIYFFLCNIRNNNTATIQVHSFSANLLLSQGTILKNIGALSLRNIYKKNGTHFHYAPIMFSVGYMHKNIHALKILIYSLMKRNVT